MQVTFANAMPELRSLCRFKRLEQLMSFVPAPHVDGVEAFLTENARRQIPALPNLAVDGKLPIFRRLTESGARFGVGRWPSVVKNIESPHGVEVV